MANPAWTSQFDKDNAPNAGPTACFRACRVICGRLGFAMPEGTIQRWQLATAEDELGNIVGYNKTESDEANNYLRSGGVAIVGINYKVGSLNRDHITDHYVVAYRYVPDTGILAALNPGSPLPADNDHNYEFTWDSDRYCWQRWDGSHRITIAMVVPPVDVAARLMERT